MGLSRLVPSVLRAVGALVVVVLALPLAAAPAEAAARSAAADATVLLDVLVEPMQTTARRSPVQVRVKNPRGQRVRLEQFDSRRWRAVSSRKAPRSGAAAWVRLPLPARAGNVRYRVVLVAGGASRPVTARSAGASARKAGPSARAFSVFQSDARKHARYVAQARAYVRQYCPSTPIFVDSPSIGPRAAGVATTTVVGPFAPAGSRKVTRMRWEQSIELRSGMSTTQLRHAAFHECAHIVQARAQVSGRKAAATRLRLTEKRYGASGSAARERQADCMASVMTGSRRHMYYLRSCTRAQLADARAMWRTYGGKRQSPTLTWTARA